MASTVCDGLSCHLNSRRQCGHCRRTNPSASRGSSMTPITSSLMRLIPSAGTDRGRHCCARRWSTPQPTQTGLRDSRGCVGRHPGSALRCIDTGGPPGRLQNSFDPRSDGGGVLLNLEVPDSNYSPSCLGEGAILLDITSNVALDL